MSEVKERLMLFIRELKLNIVNFEKSIGVSNGYVSSISKSIQPDKLKKISDLYPSLNLEWLLVGKGEMIKGSSSNTGIIGNHNKANNIVSGDNAGIVGNTGSVSGHNINIASPGNASQKIIKDGNFEMAYESLSDEATQHRINFLLAEIDSLKKIIDSLHREIASNKDVIDTKNEIIEMLKVQLGQKIQK